MKKLFCALFIVLSSCIYTFAQDKTSAISEDEKQEAVTVAENWFKALVLAQSVDSVLNLSDIPFAVDDKMVINSEKELEELFVGIFTDKGARKIPQFTANFERQVSKIIEDCIPVDVVIVKISLLSGRFQGDAVLISLSRRDNQFKVVGFRD